MEARGETRMRRYKSLLLAIGAILASAVLPCAGQAEEASGRSANAYGYNNFDPYTPIFTRFQVKDVMTSDSRFTYLLLADAINYEPLLVARGTQVHMGFWSGWGNHGSLVRLLDNINEGQNPGYDRKKCSSDSTERNCAIWDEGQTTSLQYPSYVRMLVEHWYDRGNAGPSAWTVPIYGRIYRNINPLTFEQADVIWGKYSQRYADMAQEFYLRTGKPVKVWCFVEGARKNRIFYAYEYPELQRLERAGVVRVYCAKNQNAKWTNPNDWTVGLGSASCNKDSAPVAPRVPGEIINVSNRK